jgi:ABC-type multidrug transport system fused ATPase/permease subunit
MDLSLIVKLLTKKEKQQLILVFFAQLIMGFIELLGIGSIGPFISIITNPQIIHQNEYLLTAYNYFGFNSDLEFIITFGIVVIIILAVSNFSLAVATLINQFYTGKRRHSLSMRLFEKYLRQPYIYFLNLNTATLIRNLRNVDGFVTEVLMNLLNLVSHAIVALAIIVLLVVMNPVLALIVTLTLFVLYAIIFGTVRKTLAKKGKEWQILDYVRLKYITEAFSGIKDIKILEKERVFLELYRPASLRFTNNDTVNRSINELPRFLIETVAIGGMILVILVMLTSGATIEHFLPVLTVYAFGAYRLLPLLQKMFRAVASVRYHFPVVETLYNDFTVLPNGSPLLDRKDITPLSFQSEINIENIVFSYPNSSKIILNNINVNIKYNTSIALVGPTGCGKTTLVDIILCLLAPQQGKITVDHAPVDESVRLNWQRNLGYVPQSIYLSDDTIKNNIAFGISPDDIDMESVINAAKLANIHNFISGELEDGYDTSIGERGIKLSGGQRQRIGIARAVYHNPSVLILDEATSALDSLTENVIMDAINSLNHKKTIIIIAHRITTVKSCDCIYMMNKGSITDHGSYEELYARNELFQKMADGSPSNTRKENETN